MELSVDAALDSFRSSNNNPGTSGLRIRRLLWAAASRLRNRCLLITTSLAGLALVLVGQPWIGLAVASGGGVGYAALVARDLFDPNLIRQVHGLEGSTPKLRESNTVSMRHPLHLKTAIEAIEPVDLQDAYASILGRHESIRRRLVSATPMIRESLADTYQRCSELARVSEPLVSRGRHLDRYLRMYRADDLFAELCTLEHATERAEDQQARDAFTTAAESKRRHLQTYCDVQKMYERVTAQLSVIRASLDAVEARLVKLQADGSDLGGDTAASLEEFVGGLSLELSSLESGVETLGDPL